MPVLRRKKCPVITADNADNEFSYMFTLMYLAKKARDQSGEKTKAQYLQKCRARQYDDAVQEWERAIRHFLFSLKYPENIA